jgi:hypothetical protein
MHNICAFACFSRAASCDVPATTHTTPLKRVKHVHGGLLRAGKSGKHQKKKRKVDNSSGAGGEGAGGLFAGDGLGSKPGSSSGSGSNKPGSKSRDSGHLKAAMAPAELNRLKRGGKGRKAFKSKKKHKRR